MEEIKTGLWEKQSKNGNTYYSGKITINNQEYFVTMFDNRNNKKSDKSPDYNISLKAKEGEAPAKQEATVVYDDDLPFI